jgi:hypothetical protein
MHIRQAVLPLCAAALIATVMGCDAGPTGVDAGATVRRAHFALAQSRTELCHVNNDGLYTKITVADAAYDKHIAHGDSRVVYTGECAIEGSTSLTVVFAGGPLLFSLAVVEGGPDGTDVPLSPCTAPTGCVYVVPRGSTIALQATDNPFAFSFSLAGEMIFWQLSPGEAPYQIRMDADVSIEISGDIFL